MAVGSSSSPPWNDQRQQVSFSKLGSSISRQQDTLTNSLDVSSSDDTESEPTIGRSNTQSRYLWGQLRRRARYESTSAHADVFENSRVYLLAFVVSGRAGERSTPWPEGPKTKMWVSDTMQRVWTDMAIRMGKREGRRDKDVAAAPTPGEARKVNFDFNLVR